jgi:hypothetical protein
MTPFALRLIVLGQALIRYDLRVIPGPEFRRAGGDAPRRISASTI